MPLSEANLDDPITAHLRRDYTALQAGQTVGDALTTMRDHPPAGRIIYLYVVDNDQRLVGVVPTRRLLLSGLETPLTDIMVPRPIVVPARSTVLETCEFFTFHRLLAFPVVDEAHRLVGIVDVELYTDELQEIGGRPGDDLFQLIGVHLAQSRQLQPTRAFRSRFPWLACNIVGGLVAAFLSSAFEAELQRVVAIALFIPVVLALAESVSIQSVSLALQVMHGRPPTWDTMLPRLRSELFTGLMLGGACGLVVGIVVLVWLRSGPLMACIAVGIGGGVALAAVLGLTVPYVLRLMKLEPQVAAGPLSLALADMATLLLYFNLAHWWLR